MSFKKKKISKNTFLCHVWVSSLKISVDYFSIFKFYYAYMLDYATGIPCNEL